MEMRSDTGDGCGRHRWLLYPLIALSMFAGTALAADTPSAAAKTTYRVVQLSHQFTSVAGINTKGQVAFTEFTDVTRAKFYDGRIVRDLGTFGGPSAFAFALNDRGQVAGSATIDPNGLVNNAFRWSAATGLLNIRPSTEAASSAQTINSKGELAGYATFGPPGALVTHAFFWSPQTGVLDIGSIGEFSVALAMNDARTVVGYSGSFGLPDQLFAFRWTRATGICDLGVPPGPNTSAQDINAAGHIVGGSPAFLWTPERGPIYIGPNTGERSTATKINDKDVVIGFIAKSPTTAHGFIWSRHTGLVEIGRDNPDLATSANDVNNLGQVVGAIGDRAYIWSRAQGVVDLNTRIPGAPYGLRLLSGAAVSDNGSIVAMANTGLVLLIPQCHCTTEPPVVGPVALTGTPRSNLALTLSADFKDADLRDTHQATWSWGDGNTDAGTVSEKYGTGSVSGQHVYRAPGIYTATLTVTDSSGDSAIVQRKVVVCGTGGCVAGQGALMAPGATSTPSHKGAVNASFAFLGTAQGNASVEFSAAGIAFRSEQIDSQSVRGGQVQYSGKGRVNGAGGYRFTLTAVSGTDKDRVRIRIWHAGRGSKDEIVDYDNQPGSPAASTDGQGSVLTEGAITVQSN